MVQKLVTVVCFGLCTTAKGPHCSQLVFSAISRDHISNFFSKRYFLYDYRITLRNLLDSMY